MQDETDHLSNANLGLYFRILLKICELELNPRFKDITQGPWTEESIWFDFGQGKRPFDKEGKAAYKAVFTSMCCEDDSSKELGKIRFKFTGVPRKQRKNFALNSILDDWGYYVQPDNLPKIGG